MTKGISSGTGKLIFKLDKVLYDVQQNKFQNYNIPIRDNVNNDYFLTNKKIKKYFQFFFILEKNKRVITLF